MHRPPDDYSDVLGRDENVQLRGFVRALGRSQQVRFPAGARARARAVIERQALAVYRPTGRQRRWQRLIDAFPLRGPRGYVVAALLFLLSAGVVVAATSILDLGKTTDTQSTNPYLPLGGFHRIGALHGSSRAQITYFGSGDPSSRAEQWPLVKALQQFGSLVNVRVARQRCFGRQFGDPKLQRCELPSFDLSGARLLSPYVTLRYVSLWDHAYHCTMAGVSQADWSRFVRYAKPTPRDRAAFCGFLKTHHGAIVQDPVFFIGNYEQTGLELVNIGDFQWIIVPTPAPRTTPIPGTEAAEGIPSGLPFRAIQRALISGKDPQLTRVVEDVNAETNIITALICHTDRGRPATLCRRTVIGHILARVK
jgi:hypothetical protein